jgi:hypothetical protein
LSGVRIDPSVRVIKDDAFSERGRLAIVILNDGLEEIGAYSFHDCRSRRHIVIPNDCRSRRHIVIPNAVRTIMRSAYSHSFRFMTVNLGNRLEDIGETAFERCESLEEIDTASVEKTTK